MVCTAYDAPLVWREHERVELKKGQVRVKTAYAGINYAGRVLEGRVTGRLAGVQREIPREVKAAVYAGTGSERGCERVLRLQIGVEGRPRVLHLFCEWWVLGGVRGGRVAMLRGAEGERALIWMSRSPCR